jgi:hypothetical protein
VYSNSQYNQIERDLLHTLGFIAGKRKFNNFSKPFKVGKKTFTAGEFARALDIRK